jgi:hypothetical protein
MITGPTLRLSAFPSQQVEEQAPLQSVHLHAAKTATVLFLNGEGPQRPATATTMFTETLRTTISKILLDGLLEL